MTTFKATTEGTDKLGLHAVLERYANDQWLPDHYTEQHVLGSYLTNSSGKFSRS